MREFFKTKDCYILLFFYTISNLLLLLNYDGVFWDDWVTYNQSFETLKIMYEEIQFVLIGSFATLLTRIGNQVFPFRFYIFVFGFLNGVFLYQILKSLNLFDRNSVFFLTMLFLVVPLFGGKNAMTPYGLPVFCYYFGFYILTIYFENPRLWKRALALLLFYCSFSLNSFLVFYFFAGAYIYYMVWKQNGKKFFKSSYLTILKYPDFLILPIAYFLVKTIFFVPYGDYVGYNEVKTEGVLNSFPLLVASFDFSYLYLFESSWQISKIFWPIILVVAGLLSLHQRKFKNYSYWTIAYFLFGAFAFALAAFPYTVVGKLPMSTNFNSRHQALLPLGAAFMTYMSVIGISQLVGVRKKITLATLWFIILLFVGNNIHLSYRFHKDNFYQVSLQENMKDNKLIREKTTFLAVNQLGSNLVYDRPIDYYEWSGHLKKIFNDETRLMVSVEFLDRLDFTLKVQKYKQNNFSNWTQSEPYLVTISPKQSLNKREFLYLFYLHLFDKALFREKCKPLTEISVQKYVGKDWFKIARGLKNENI
ncbi:hypothetical protein [Leptospira ilyithenensis]|uniref:Glycosyltransferase RgtA/B/C/D-like domain-containing protein n=1 Tax=Leptospira ilyithenensis TaxID=2484901 RepID=A0A4R9LMU8_9LEPT|nr:hypothetical protein [Leptospira ilyithenensis]TGN07969.1 hypothetical protein EHS11_13605 [Leptospira ilyithenensis]